MINVYFVLYSLSLSLLLFYSRFSFSLCVLLQLYLFCTLLCGFCTPFVLSLPLQSYCVCFCCRILCVIRVGGNYIFPPPLSTTPLQPPSWRSKDFFVLFLSKRWCFMLSKCTYKRVAKFELAEIRVRPVK
uniref:Uncharacterized protein n=1 Tax=Cacopsylla melanoneura TaxID=428564 RepID=A0A8D9BLH1_9HEMI